MVTASEDGTCIESTWAVAEANVAVEARGDDASSMMMTDDEDSDELTGAVES